MSVYGAETSIGGSCFHVYCNTLPLIGKPAAYMYDVSLQVCIYVDIFNYGYTEFILIKQCVKNIIWYFEDGIL